ncbi:MAG TPA: methyltransferase, partial [Chitinophagaceae bacterium]|nr:methyltransferase [Chitinophagaceae bacterium]
GIDAVEIDSDAAAQAGENIDASPWKKNIRVFNEDIAAFHAPYSYDIIISNPPFYENELQSDRAAKNTAHHSSHLTIKMLAEVIKKHLSETGIFHLLLPAKRINEIKALFDQNGLYFHTSLSVKQTTNHAPFRIMVAGGRIKKGPASIEITIMDSGHYTPEFKALLKDYYLHL